MANYLAPAIVGGRAYLAPKVPPTFVGTPLPDGVPPTFAGVLAHTKTSSTITVDWSGVISSDNVAVARCEYRLGGSGAYIAASSAEEASKQRTFAGLAPGTAYQIELRCVDTSNNVSQPLTIVVTTSAAPPVGGGGTNYIRGTLSTRAGVLHLNLASLSWSLFAQLLPGNFAAPVAKGTHAMTAGSAELKIGVSATAAPAGWYMLAVSDLDGTTTVLSRVLVGP